MCKLFEINAQQDFKKLVIFSISSKHFIIETLSVLFSVILGFESFVPRPLVGEMIKVTMSIYFAL